MAAKYKIFFILILSFILAFSSIGCTDGTFEMFNDNPSSNAKDDHDADDKEDDKEQSSDDHDTIDWDPSLDTDMQTQSANANLEGWTIMLYLNGSNLESEGGEATNNLVSLLSIPLPDNVNVLIYTGGTKEWKNDLIDPTQNQIWEVDGDNLVLLESMNPMSMGKSSTLSQFMEYGQNLYPNTRRALFFWNHGAGSIYGFGVDELFNGDGLTLAEMRTAFIDSFDGQKYDIIGFDACLMASVETASIFSPYAHYMVASEELEPGGGWNYEYTFAALADNPQISGMDLGIAITDGYYKKYEYTEWESITTCSVIDLSHIPLLEDKLGRFASQLNTNIESPENLSSVAGARQRAESYGESPGAVPYDLIDLYSFVEELQDDSTPALSAELMKAIEDAVVYEVSGSQRIYSYGLSIYFPFASAEYFEHSIGIYNELGFCFEYHQFIADFAANISSQSYLSFMPEYNPELQELSSTDMGSEGGEPLYSVQLTDKEMEYMSFVYCALGWSINNSVVLDLGIDSDLNIDFDTNTVYDDFDCSWTGLNGQLVSLFVMEETDDYVVYSVPVLYNGIKQ